METVVSTKADRKADRRREKHKRRLVRRLDGWQQYRALWDGIDFKRQLINMGDKKVRFALVVAGGLNAVLVLVLTRGSTIASLPEVVRWAIVALLAVYGVATLSFTRHVIEALRPRPEARQQDAKEWERRESVTDTDAGNGTSPGLIIRGALTTLSFDAERQLWNEARLADVTAELILFNRASSAILQRQLDQIGQVYERLKILALLTAAVLALVVGTNIVRGNPSQNRPVASTEAPAGSAAGATDGPAAMTAATPSGSIINIGRSRPGTKM